MSVPKRHAEPPAKNINVRLDPALWARAKAQAIREERTLKRWLERAIREALGRAAKRT